MQRRDLLDQLDNIADNLEGIRTSLVTLPSESSLVDDEVEGEKRFLRRGKLFVDLARHVVLLDEHMLNLSPTEFKLLAYLMDRAPQVVSPLKIVREVQGYESKPWEASEIVRQHIYRIRQKCQEATRRQNIIRTVRGVGYTID
jgi:two-component system alkaline phosphatase synthesis response regulator PhoP